MFTLYFSVSVPFQIPSDHFVFVSGSHPNLGSWDTRQALKLEKGANDHWIGITSLGVDTVKFRYFIGYFLQSEAAKDPVLVVSKWETHLTPRCVMPPVEASKSGACRANLRDIFGFSGGREHISDSFLLADDIQHIALTLSGAALKFYKQKHMQQNFRLKIVPFDLRNKIDISNLDDDDEPLPEDEAHLPTLPSHSCTEIAALTQDCPKFRVQNEFGELFHNATDYFTFRTYSVAVEFLSFRIEVYSSKNNDIIAQGYALPSTLQDTYGKTSIPLLTKNGIPIGKVYLGYLFIRPIRLPHPHPTMHNCYAKHWKKRTTLEVGHRGMGDSYTKFAVARENTLHSMNSAAKAGADFVEFDVHLTKDKVAIVYHDFHVMVSVTKKRAPTSTDSRDSTDSEGKKLSSEGPSPLVASSSSSSSPVDFYQLAVKDLKLNQLRLLHLDHVTHKEQNSQHQNGQTASESLSANTSVKRNSHQLVTGEHDEEEEHRPFPTLLEALENVSHEVGFNIEVKYPQMLVNGENECEGYIERNEFLDIILAEVLNHAGSGRRIVFSSFDADICKMICAKQKKYPVLFLCLAESSRHINYADERNRTSLIAVKFAHAAGLMGVNFNSEDLLRDPSPVKKAKELGLVSFVWGDELAERKHLEYFKKILLVEGIIYDRIGEGESRTNVFTLEKEMKAALFSSNRKHNGKSSPPRCFSHNQLNKQGIDAASGAIIPQPGNVGRSRGMSASAWSQGLDDDKSFANSSFSGSSAMFSIGEGETISGSTPTQEQQIFPVIRRHNSSQVHGSFGFLPAVAAAFLESQMSSSVSENGGVTGGGLVDMAAPKRLMTTTTSEI